MTDFPDTEEIPRPYVGRRKQPCAAGCGTMTVNRWCSMACMAIEDGPPDEWLEEEVDDDE